METLELGFVDVLHKLRQTEEDEGVGGGVTHIKGHKGPSKLEEVSNGSHHIVQLVLPSFSKIFSLHKCLLRLWLLQRLISGVIVGGP